MLIPVSHSKLAGKKVEVKSASLFGGSSLWVNGQKAVPTNGIYTVANKGKNVKLKIVSSFPDPVPSQVEIDGAKVVIGKPLQWYEYLWLAVLFVVMLRGLWIGLIIGVPAIHKSLEIFHDPKRSALEKFGISLALTIGVVIAIGVVAGLLFVGVASRIEP